jgi:hypothetical protein
MRSDAVTGERDPRSLALRAPLAFRSGFSGGWSRDPRLHFFVSDMDQECQR